jgi:hypothetical protein
MPSEVHATADGDSRQIIASSERVCRTHEERDARKGEASARKTHDQGIADTRQMTKAEGDKDDMTKDDMTTSGTKKRA